MYLHTSRNSKSYTYLTNFPFGSCLKLFVSPMTPVFSTFSLTKTTSRCPLLAFSIFDFKDSTHENEDPMGSKIGDSTSMFYNQIIFLCHVYMSKIILKKR